MDQIITIQLAEEIIGLYEKFGDQDYIGEPVSQIAHMCQCAQLAEASGADEETILAAFLHDIGHLCEFAFIEKRLLHMDEFGVIDHEKFGAAYLSDKGFSKKVIKLVQNHVEAKRYLTYKFPEYYNVLSDASKQTLSFQGGVMTNKEAAEFETDEFFEQHVLLRRWDDEAKNNQKPLPNLLPYKEIITQHLLKQKNKL